MTSSIDDFPVLQRQMEAFTLRLDHALVAKREHILNSKQHHHVKVHELEAREAALNSTIASLKTKIDKTRDVTLLTLKHLQQQQTVVAELQKKLAALETTRDTLHMEIAHLETSIAKLTDQHTSSKSELDAQVKKDHPELRHYEAYLGLRLEVVAANVLRFYFTNVDANDADKEVWCEVDVSGDSVVVVALDPVLAPEAGARATRVFDEKKLLVFFLKTIRGELAKA